MERLIKCKICASNDFVFWAKSQDIEYFTSNDEYSYYECRNCKTLFIYPVPCAELSKIYPSNYYSFGKNAAVGILHKIKSLFDYKFFKTITNKMDGDRLSALGIGGGTGFVLKTLANADKRFVDGTVVDFDAASESAAREHGFDFVCAKIEDTNFSRKFDIILMLNLIEHVSDPLQVLKKIKKLLNLNGRIIIKTPNYQSLDAALFKNRSWAGYHCPRHWVIFSEISLRKAMDIVGLDIETFHYTQGAPFWAGSITNYLYKMGLVSVGRERPMPSHPIVSVFLIFFAIFDFIRARMGFATSQVFLVAKLRD